MAKLADFRITYSGSRRLLRFTSTMTNWGRGALEIRATRPNTSTPWNVDQVIFNSAGGSRRVDTVLNMSYGGDGHGHWHVNRMVDVDMWSTFRHAAGAKLGYCFFDTTIVNRSLPGARGTPFYRESMCARQTGLTNRVGISVGWGDKYQWSLPFQWIDITGLPSGEYRVRAIVDARNRLVESNDANNCTYTRIGISRTSNVVTILGSGSVCTDDWRASPYAADIQWAMEKGLHPGCGVDLFCPNERVTRAELATWLALQYGPPETDQDLFTDDEASPAEADINRTAAAGITAGCTATTYCPTAFASRGELATYVVHALGLPPTDTDYFTDDETSPHEANINALAEAGLAIGCGEGLYCAFAAVLRAPLAAVLHRGEGLPPPG
jgi:hypothetical protein